MQHTTAILFTVDVEGKKGVCELDKQFDLVVKGTKCGINKILNIAESNDIKLTFFVDVYEIKKSFGQVPVKHLTKSIFEMGHDVQLHTHPGPYYDYKRNKMYQFTQSEQEEIIKTGANLIHKWTGQYPKAHRAGAYAADIGTIHGLKSMNFKLDSSYYFNHKNCKLNETFHFSNDLYNLAGILELPITIYNLIERPRHFHNFFKSLRSQKKIDIDASSLSEMQEAVLSAVRKKYNTVTVFMHSFSLIKDNKVPDFNDIEKLEKFMQWVKKRKFKTMTCHELLDNPQVAHRPVTHANIPTITRELSLLVYLLKRIKRRN